MQAFAPKVLIWWIVAATAHLPIPVCDGGDIGSLPASAGAVTCEKGMDIDFILLGCYGPGDFDDSPFHHDPSRDTPVLGLFPPYLWSRAETSGPLPERWLPLPALPWGQRSAWILADWAPYWGMSVRAPRLAECCRDTCVLRL